jgi:pSer/pThr/pTyr-binding forkhead associated (FHA) protein
LPQIFLDVLKYLFLALIFLFLLRAIKAMYLEVSGPRSAPRGAGRIPALPKVSKPPERMVVVAGDDTKPRTYSLENEVIIGRDQKCHVVLTDSYASQIHARIFRRDSQVLIEDMGSTNGTRLNGRRVTSPTPVSRGDKARIGKTEFQFKR